MGTWANPQKVEDAVRVEELLASPLPARGANKALSDVIGNDSLFDLIDTVEAEDPSADVRPLVAMLLDEWVNWTPPSEFRESWEPEARDRIVVTSSRFRDLQIDFPKAAVKADLGEVRAAVCVATDSDPDDTPGWEVRDVFGFAAFVGRNQATGEWVYVNRLNGCVSGVPAKMAEAVFTAEVDAPRP